MKEIPTATLRLVWLIDKLPDTGVWGILKTGLGRAKRLSDQQ
jgi:hypothetical protein